MKLGTICYIRYNNKTLMLHRIKKENDMHKGKWNGLGGKLDKGESPQECVVREVIEESGLKIKNPKLKGIITFPASEYPPEDWYVFVFVATQFSGELTETREGVLKWIDNDKLLDLNIWEGDKLFMKWIEKDKIFSAKFMYKNKKLVNYDVDFY
ncbi:MAG: ADP-ribose pyrophosphatase [Candidatus Woesearchaeota archaeon]|nr:ADP-ribose pyrophosphatase [Candidatus Woesearchaeota archaeon]